LAQADDGEPIQCEARLIMHFGGGWLDRVRFAAVFDIELALQVGPSCTQHRIPGRGRDPHILPGNHRLKGITHDRPR